MQCVSISAFTMFVSVWVSLGCVRKCVLEMREQSYTPWRAEPNSCSSMESLLSKFHRKWKEIIFTGNRVPSCLYVSFPLCLGRHPQTSGGFSVWEEDWFCDSNYSVTSPTILMASHLALNHKINSRFSHKNHQMSGHTCQNTQTALHTYMMEPYKNCTWCDLSSGADSTLSQSLSLQNCRFGWQSYRPPRFHQL